MAQSFQPSAFQNSAFEVGYYVDLTKGTFTLTGNTAGTTRALKVSADQGTFTLTGNAATLPRTYNITASIGTFAITSGANNDVDVGYKVFGAQGSYTYTGRADGGLRFSYDQSTGTFSYTGNANDLIAVRQLPLTKGTLTFASTGVNLEKTGAYQIGANLGSYFLTGRNSTFYLLRALNGDNKQFVITGGTGNQIGKGYKLPLTKGAFTYTGNIARFPITMPAEPGQYLITGNQGARNITRNPLLAGTFTFTGYAANFAIVMPADRGVFTKTGNAASLLVRKRSFELNRAIQMTGNDAELTRTSRVALASGTYVTTGQALSFALVRRLSIPQANYSFSGNNVSFGKIRGLAGDYGTFTVTFDLQGFKSDRLAFTERELDATETAGTIIIPAENRIMEITR